MRNIKQEQIEKTLKESQTPVLLGLTLYKNNKVSFFDLTHVIFKNGYSNPEFEAFLRKECIAKSEIQTLFHEIKQNIKEKFLNHGHKPLPFSPEDHSWKSKVSCVYQEMITAPDVNISFLKEVLTSSNASVITPYFFWTRLHLIPEKNKLTVFSTLVDHANLFNHPLTGKDVYMNYYLENSSDTSDNGKIKESFIKQLPSELIKQIKTSTLKEMIDTLTDKFNQGQYCGDLKFNIIGTLKQKLALLETVELSQNNSQNLPTFNKIKL